MKAHQLINQDSGNTEYYTPIEIVEAAREVMGGIDLDPASSVQANDRIGALSIFTEADNGLMQPWFGKVWMNHPFSRADNARWIRKAVWEFEGGTSVQQITCITFAATSEKWFQPLLPFPQCFLCPRTNYYLPDGRLKRGVTKGSVVTYMGPNVEKFALVFDRFGWVK